MHAASVFKLQSMLCNIITLIALPLAMLPGLPLHHSYIWVALFYLHVPFLLEDFPSEPTSPGAALRNLSAPCSACCSFGYNDDQAVKMFMIVHYLFIFSLEISQ